MSLRTIDLFCGAGGSSWGARSAGASIVGAVDAWDVAVATYNDNFSGVAKCLRMKPSTRAGVLGEIGKVEMILASPECTNHTCARGSKPRDEESRETARYVLSFARTLRPRWIVVENVVHMRSWCGYNDLIRKLERHYKVLPQVIDAAAYGVPQMRKRLFLLCDSAREPRQVMPPETARTRTARDIIDWDWRWPARPLFDGRKAEPTLERARRAIAELGPGRDFLIVYYGTDGSGGWQPVDKPLRTLTTLDRFGLVQYRDGEPMLRMLQVPELRRAMGYTDDFVMERGTRRDKIRLLGNGVCPPVMTAIVRSLTG